MFKQILFKSPADMHQWTSPTALLSLPMNLSFCKQNTSEHDQLQSTLHRHQLEEPTKQHT